MLVQVTEGQGLAVLDYVGLFPDTAVRGESADSARSCPCTSSWGVFANFPDFNKNIVNIHELRVS